jgi:phosphoglycolate phosphatase
LKEEIESKRDLSFKAVIFDFDGTLVDSLHGIAAAMNCALRDFGLPGHSWESYQTRVGEGIAVLAKKAAPTDWEGSMEELIAKYRQHYALWMWESVRLYEGISALLNTLQELGVPMAVLSNKGDDFIQALSKTLLASWNFAEIRGEREGAFKKPNPTSALEIARSLHVKPEEIVFVGDTPVDMKTACAAGMRAIGVSWGFRREEELYNSGASFVLNSPLQLLSLSR